LDLAKSLRDWSSDSSGSARTDKLGSHQREASGSDLRLWVARGDSLSTFSIRVTYGVGHNSRQCPSEVLLREQPVGSDLRFSVAREAVSQPWGIKNTYGCGHKLTAMPVRRVVEQRSDNNIGVNSSLRTRRRFSRADRKSTLWICRFIVRLLLAAALTFPNLPARAGIL